MKLSTAGVIALALHLVGCGQPVLPTAAEPSPVVHARPLGTKSPSPRTPGQELHVRAKTALASKNFSQATEIAEQLDKLEPDGKLATSIRIEIASASGNKAGAQKLLKLLEKRFPDDPDAIVMRANYLAMTGKPDDGIALLMLHNKKKPSDTLLAEQGFIMVSMKNDASQAEKLFTEALAINPNNRKALANRGMCRIQRQDYQNAVLDLTQAIELDPNDGTHYYPRAVAFLGLHKLEDSLSDCDKCLELAPEFTPAYILRADLRAQQNDVAGARADANRVIELNRDPASVARAQEQLNEFK